MKNIVRGILLICIVLLAFEPRGFGDLGAYIILCFLIEYFFFLERKPQAIINDSSDKYYVGKKVLATIISPATLLLGFYLVKNVVPTHSNIKPGIIMIFIIILLFKILYIDIKRREGTLRKSILKGSTYGALISLVLFSFMVFNL